MQRFVWFCLLVVSLFAEEKLYERFPACSYVLSEFDIERDFMENTAFIRFVQHHQKHVKKEYQQALSREDGLPRLLRRILMEEGMSDLFLYLSVVESGLSAEARSQKEATGLWQFMPQTAKVFKLHIDGSVDERYDPYASTHAAIAYLERLHARFGKWYLAAMAYNCGEGRMEKALKAAGTDDLSVLLDDEAKYLPKETRDYMRKILLVAMIGESESVDAGREAPVAVEVAGGTTLQSLASLLKMSTSKLEAMNRRYKQGRVPEGERPCEVWIPESKLAQFYLRYRLPETAVHPKPYLFSHTVKLGETLASIAQRYQSSAAEIKAVNHLSDDMLEVGRLLLIPVSRSQFDDLLRTP